MTQMVTDLLERESLCHEASRARVSKRMRSAMTATDIQ